MELSAHIPDALRDLLRSQGLTLPRPISGTRRGAHRSRRSGAGHDFHEHRAYAPGDDLRQIDWRAAGRRERLVIRQTESQEQLSVLMLLDRAAGMDYRTKIEVANAFAAVFASLAFQQDDRLGFLIGRDGRLEDRSWAPTTARDRLRSLAHDLHAGPAGLCPWPDMLTRAATGTPRNSLFIVVSDFLDPDPRAARDPTTETKTTSAPGRQDPDRALLEGLAHLRARGHTILLVQILHDDELTFPWDDRGFRRFEDLAGTRPAVEGAGGLLRPDYLAAIGGHLNWLTRVCEETGLHLQRVVAGRDDLGDAMISALSRLAGLAQPAPRVQPVGTPR